MPLFIEFGIKGKDDFERIKSRFDPEDMIRYPKKWSDELLDYYRSIDRPVGIGLLGIFGYVRGMMGMERLLVSFHRDPKLVHEMFDFFVDFQIEAARKAVEEVNRFCHDMGGNGVPHWPPNIAKSFRGIHASWIQENNSLP
jgi:hypothetical protein